MQYLQVIELQKQEIQRLQNQLETQKQQDVVNRVGEQVVEDYGVKQYGVGDYGTGDYSVGNNERTFAQQKVVVDDIWAKNPPTEDVNANMVGKTMVSDHVKYPF